MFECTLEENEQSGLLLLWDVKYKDIKKLEAFIKLKASKLKDCGGAICHVE